MSGQNEEKAQGSQGYRGAHNVVKREPQDIKEEYDEPRDIKSEYVEPFFKEEPQDIKSEYVEQFVKVEPQDIKRENDDLFVKTEPEDMKAEYEEKMLKAEDIKEEEYDPGEKRTDDSSSRPFFHKNSVTNVSVREKPDVKKSVGELMLSKCQWKEYKTKKSGKVFYHNNHTKESVWTIPKELQDIKDRIKADADHVPHKSKVSKKRKPESTAVLELKAPVSNKEEPAETEKRARQTSRNSAITEEGPRPVNKGRKVKYPNGLADWEWTKCLWCSVFFLKTNIFSHYNRCEERQKELNADREYVEREKVKQVEAFKASVRRAEEAAARARQNLSRAANPSFETFESLDEDMAEDMFSWSPPPSP